MAVGQVSAFGEAHRKNRVARFENGVLMLTLPKRTGAQGRQLPVR